MMIFLAGMPRSGTSWIGKIFDSSLDTAYYHEPDNYLLMNMPLAVDEDQFNLYENYLNTYIDNILSIKNVSVRGKLPVFKKSYLSRFDQYLYSQSIYPAKLLAKVGINAPVLIKTNNKIIIPVWKSIESIGRFGLITKALPPQSKSILIIRHPCGYASSVLRGERDGKFGKNVHSSEDYGLLESLMGTESARKYNVSIKYLKTLEPIERLTWGWVLFNEKALIEASNAHNSKLVIYDDLCLNPLKTAKDLFSFAGLKWSEQCRHFIESSTNSEYQSKSNYYSVNRNPIFASSRWREELSVKEKHLVCNIVKKTILDKYFDLDVN